MILRREFFLPDRCPLCGLPLGVAVAADAPLHDERVLLHDEAEAAVVDRHEDRATDVDCVFRDLWLSKGTEVNWGNKKLLQS